MCALGADPSGAMAEVVVEAVSGAEKRRQALLEVRRRDSDAKRAHVRDTVEKMLLASECITFAAVARRAKVSSWLVYAEGVREQIQTAIRQQAEEPPETRDRSSAGVASLRTDLALAREEIKRLRSDNDKLRRTAQRLLGQQLDQVNVAELIARIDTLELTKTAAWHMNCTRPPKKIPGCSRGSPNSKKTSPRHAQPCDG
jgi:Family of unknown function (DUF6262)